MRKISKLPPDRKDMFKYRTPITKNIIIHPKMLRKLKEWLKESE